MIIEAALINTTSPAGSFLRLIERELDPRDVIAEILEEHLIPDPRAVADAIVQHLRDAGFEIRPTRRDGAAGVRAITIATVATDCIALLR